MLNLQNMLIRDNLRIFGLEIPFYVFGTASAYCKFNQYL